MFVIFLYYEIPFSFLSVKVLVCTVELNITEVPLMFDLTKRIR